LSLLRATAPSRDISLTPDLSGRSILVAATPRWVICGHIFSATSAFSAVKQIDVRNKKIVRFAENPP